MRQIAVLCSKGVGVLLMLLAVVQWITFDYPDANPLRGSGLLAPGMLSQVVNWLIVAVVAAVGWGFFTLGSFKLPTGEREDEGKGHES